MSTEELEFLAGFVWLAVPVIFFFLFAFAIRSYFLGGIKSKDKNLKQLIIEAIVEASLEIEKRNRANQQRAKRGGNGLELDEWEEVKPINPITLD